ncbi:hypothetical protein L3X38_025216 [Prunus dulcis]|uniref:Uncharacterized protein n=1 Tax=Prunus dulcis TaxID=3755 RepID=A0AAD4W2F7_PRUDU|nr:hypothetical protein L3X38_025216 [Prunus dulcis]
MVELTIKLTFIGPSEWTIENDGGLRYRGKLCVPESKNLKREILDEAHRSKYTVHPGSKGKTSATIRVVETFIYPYLEMGKHCHGFHGGLPKTKKGHDAIWVIMDRLTKSAYFLPVSMKYKVDTLGKLYIREVVKLQGILVSIVSDRDARFTSKFWSSFQKPWELDRI